MFSQRTNWNLEPNRLAVAYRRMRQAGREILDLTISNPTHAGFQYDDTAILHALSNPKSLVYDPQPKGLLCARKAITEYYSQQATAAAVDPESLILTTSTSEAYSFIFRLVANAGDEILVPKPSYPLFDFLADLQDIGLAGYPLIYDHGWHIDFASLEQAVTDRTRGVIVVHPNNPTGSYTTAEERERLNECCARLGLPIIADEVFLDYQLSSGTVRSFADNTDVLTFSLSGISKISALPQMKLAWMAVSGPSEKAHAALARLEVIADTYLSLNTPIQLASLTLLEQRKSIQPQLLSRVRCNLGELDCQLGLQTTCSRLEVEGGWCAVIRVPATRPDEELAIDLLQGCAVLVHPGHFYDFPRDGYLVVSLIAPTAEFQKGISRVLNFLSQCPSP